MATKEVNLQHVDDLIFISDVHFGARAASDEWMDNFVDYFIIFKFVLSALHLLRQLFHSPFKK